MEPERLQVIKRNVSGVVRIDDAEDLWRIAKELITALENQGELLQLSLANVDRLNEELVTSKIALDAAKAFMEKAEESCEQAQAELDYCRDDVVPNLHTKIDNLRKQLAEAQADRDEAIKREADQFAKDRNQLAEAQDLTVEAQHQHQAEISTLQAENKRLEDGIIEARLESNDRQQ